MGNSVLEYTFLPGMLFDLSRILVGLVLILIMKPGLWEGYKAGFSNERASMSIKLAAFGLIMIVSNIIENGIVIETAEKTIQLECDDVIMSCGYMPDTRLVDGGTQQGKTNIHIVGDVKKVGNLKTAIWEAYDLAFSL